MRIFIITSIFIASKYIKVYAFIRVCVSSANCYIRWCIVVFTRRVVTAHIVYIIQRIHVYAICILRLKILALSRILFNKHVVLYGNSVRQTSLRLVRVLKRIIIFSRRISCPILCFFFLKKNVRTLHDVQGDCFLRLTYMCGRIFEESHIEPNCLIIISKYNAYST